MTTDDDDRSPTKEFWVGERHRFYLKLVELWEVDNAQYPDDDVPVAKAKAWVEALLILASCTVIQMADQDMDPTEALVKAYDVAKEALSTIGKEAGKL